MADLVSVQIIVQGWVQGVFFRAFIARHATALGLAGLVRNLPDRKTVEVQAEGERKALEKLIDYLKVGPSGAKVEQVVTNWSVYTGNYINFTIKY